MRCKPSRGPAPLELELQSELDLALTVIGEIAGRSLRGNLAKRAVARIVVRAIELRSVEGVEVIHLKNARETFSHVELLSGIQIFDQDRRVPHALIVPL